MVGHGFDVSDDQGAVDWRQASVGVEAVGVQVGYAARAAWFDTRTGQANVHSALACGLKVAPYFFAFPVPGDAHLQGLEFGRMVRHLESEGADFELPLAVDVELNPEGMGPAALSQWVRDFLAATGYDPRRLAVYSMPGFWNAATDGTPINAHCWIAAWGAPSAPRLKGLPAPYMWQTTNRGRVPGIATAVDLDTLLYVPDAGLPPGEGDKGTVTWTVRAGQTLEDVARQYLPRGATPAQVGAACFKIMAANNLSDTAIQEGDRIKVPQPL